jgi:hypothetical protein
MSEHKTNNDIKKIYMLQFKTQNKRKGKKKKEKSMDIKPTKLVRALGSRTKEDV